jgi:hypothetical protein
MTQANNEAAKDSKPLSLYVAEIWDWHQDCDVAEEPIIYAVAADSKEQAIEIAMADHKADELSTESARIDRASVRQVTEVIGPNNRRHQISVHPINVTLCPHDGEVMEHTIIDDTHIYSCPECPNVMMEYSNSKNMEALRKYLGEGR